MPVTWGSEYAVTVDELTDWLVIALESVTVADGVKAPTWDTVHFTDQLVAPVQPEEGNPVQENWSPPEPPTVVALNQTAWFRSSVPLEGWMVEIVGSVCMSMVYPADESFPAASSTTTSTYTFVAVVAVQVTEERVVQGGD
jgi:hypothetical protein